jgi:hypothetical protein
MRGVQIMKLRSIQLFPASCCFLHQAMLSYHSIIHNVMKTRIFGKTLWQRLSFKSVTPCAEDSKDNIPTLVPYTKQRTISRRSILQYWSRLFQDIISKFRVVIMQPCQASPPDILEEKSDLKNKDIWRMLTRTILLSWILSDDQ